MDVLQLYYQMARLQVCGNIKAFYIEVKQWWIDLQMYIQISIFYSPLHIISLYSVYPNELEHLAGKHMVTYSMTRYTVKTFTEICLPFLLDNSFKSAQRFEMSLLFLCQVIAHKRKKINLSLFARDNDSERIWNFIKGCFYATFLPSLLEHLSPNDQRPMPQIWDIFLKDFSLNISFLHKPQFITEFFGLLLGLLQGFLFIVSFVWGVLSPALPTTGFPYPLRCHLSEKPYQALGKLYSLLSESYSQELMHRSCLTPLRLL